MFHNIFAVVQFKRPECRIAATIGWLGMSASNSGNRRYQALLRKAFCKMGAQYQYPHLRIDGDVIVRCCLSKSRYGHHRKPKANSNYQTTEIDFGFISTANIYMIQVNGAVVEWCLSPSWEAMPIRLKQFPVRPPQQAAFQQNIINR
jgi:hypothetical protein